MKQRSTLYILLAILTIIIWSSTFISTKIVLSVFSPIEILVYRFALAYLSLLVVYPKFHKPESLRSEITLFLAGFTGVSLYFLAENFALSFSLASNVALLVSTAPILTAVGAHFFLKNEKISRFIVLGGIVAFLGVGLVIFNGKFILKLNPLGDCLAIVSALVWSVYSILIKRLSATRSTLYITRKIFFYALLTMIPVVIVFPPRLDFTPLYDWKIAGHFFFLSVLASGVAYVIWSKVIWALGATRANNFIYFIPLLTLAESAIILREPLTFFALIGAGLIFTGVYLSSRKVA